MNVIRSLKNIARPIVYYLPERMRRSRRSKELKESRPTISKDRLIRDLGALPIRPEAVVLVHSSLKALGYVEGGAATVVDALVEGFVTRNRGTVLLPTYTINGTMYTTLSSGRVFDVSSTPSNLGAIPEAFRRHPQARRSIHPTHSFAAVGRDAQWLVNEHHTCGTSFGPSSPMAKMLEVDSYLLGLGTNLGTVTFYHCLEEIEDNFPMSVFTADSPLSVECRGYNGEVFHLALRAHDSSVSQTRIDGPENHEIRDFFTARFERHAGLTWHQVGEAKAWLVEAGQFYREAKRLMQGGITIYSTPSQISQFESRISSADGAR